MFCKKNPSNEQKLKSLVGNTSVDRKLVHNHRQLASGDTEATNPLQHQNVTQTSTDTNSPKKKIYKTPVIK